MRSRELHQCDTGDHLSGILDTYVNRIETSYKHSVVLAKFECMLIATPAERARRPRHLEAFSERPSRMVGQPRYLPRKVPFALCTQAVSGIDRVD